MNNRIQQQKLKLIAIAGGIILLHVFGLFVPLVVGIAWVALLVAGSSLILSREPLAEDVRRVINWLKRKGAEL
ncbi:MAG: hypothetical protein ACOC0A_03320 [Planctomycetota bacterium]